MHPYITEALAAEHRQDLLRAARRYRKRADRTAVTAPRARRQLFANGLRNMTAGYVITTRRFARRGRHDNTLRPAHDRTGFVDLCRDGKVASVES